MRVRVRRARSGDGGAPESCFGALYAGAMCRVVKKRSGFLERLVGRIMTSAEAFRSALAHVHVAPPAPVGVSPPAAAVTAGGGGGAGAAAGTPAQRALAVRKHMPVLREARGAAAALMDPFDPRFAAFVAATVAYLPYATEEEPLCVIFHVNRAVALCGG